MIKNESNDSILYAINKRFHENNSMIVVLVDSVKFQSQLEKFGKKVDISYKIFSNEI